MIFFINNLFISFKAFVQSISCGDAEEQNLEEIVALTRDHRGRANPDELLNGFIPVWAVVIYTIAGSFSFRSFKIRFEAGFLDYPN